MCNRDRWTVLWQFKTKRFHVSLACQPDADYVFDEFDEQETRDKINSGEWTVFVFRVRVACDGLVLGDDYLGGSIYEDPATFRDHIGRNAAGYGSYFSDMVSQAVREARQTLAKAPRMRAVA